MTSPVKTEPAAQKNAKSLGNRAFGLIFSVIFLVIATFPLLRSGDDVRLWALMVSGGLLAISLIVPGILTPLNRLWAAFGMLMHKITNPLLMGLVFFLTVLPTGIMLRLLRKDPMRQKREPLAESYWISREQNSITPQFFDQQF